MKSKLIKQRKRAEIKMVGVVLLEDGGGRGGMMLVLYGTLPSDLGS